LSGGHRFGSVPSFRDWSLYLANPAVGGGVIAAIALGIGIVAVGIDAITSPVAMSSAAITLAIVRVAVIDVVVGGVAEGCAGPSKP
jgi:hypothetical protein